MNIIPVSVHQSNLCEDEFMKRKFFLPMLALILTLSCSFLSSGGTAQPADTPVPIASVEIPTVDFDAPANPVNVTVELDETNSTSGMFSTNGSVMSLTGADGTVFTLEIPPGALEADTAITMTVVKSMGGAPLSRDIFAVQLEPSGLLLNEIATLTIQPAQEIPVKNQVVFGYEGRGEDYHLAMVDPNSREIKVKLMGFSGAGVGFAADVDWAKNLSIQANGARERLAHEFGKITQAERQRQLLGESDEASRAEWGDAFQKNLEKFYDQVVQKELAAAELDCSRAEQALHDLIQVERQKQLLGLSESDQPKIVDFEGKFDKLQKIYDECKVAYHISGNIDDAHVEGNVCDVRKPFTLAGILTFSFTPTNAKMGTYTFTGPFDATGVGTYLIYDNGTMLVTGTGCVMGGNCATYDHQWAATRLDPKNCTE